MIRDMALFERALRAQGARLIAGVDEAGRGPLAGPVVAAACILPEEAYFSDLNDSKQLSSKKREELFERLQKTPGVHVAIASVDAAAIDAINIFQATLLAMQRAVAALPQRPDYILVDGRHAPSFGIPARALISGDARSVSIAAASIFAKVTRDAEMRERDKEFPKYGFARHKGYPTEQHRKALQMHGPCPIHRKTFAPVRGCQEINFTKQPLKECLCEA